MSVEILPAFPGGGGSAVRVDGSIIMPSGTREIVPTLVAFGAGPSDSATTIPVPMGSSVSWGFTSGTGPQLGTLRLQRGWVEQITNAVNNSSDKALRLTYGGQALGSNGGLSNPNDGGSGGAIDLTFERLSLTPPTSGDFIHDTLNWADRRYWWNRKTVTKSYNIVRQTTDRFVYSFQTIVAGGKGLSDSVRYFTEWSVNTVNGAKKPWSAIAIVHDILTTVLKIDNADIIYYDDVIGATELVGAQILTVPLFGAGGGASWPGASAGTISIGGSGATGNVSAYIPQNVQILGEPADVALGRFLRMAGADLYIGADGKVYVYSTVTVPAVAQEQALISDLSQYLTSGALNVINFASIRPSAVVVQFEAEREMVFVYEENGTDTDTKVAKTQAAAQDQINNRVIFVENVTRALTNDQVPGFPRGSFIPITAALAAFGNKYGSGPISLEDFRNYWGQTGVAAVALALGSGANPTTFSNTLAVQAWQQIRNDYRTLFRIPATVMERLKDIKPLLAGVTFPQTGARANAEVFGQITWLADVNVRIANFTGNGLRTNSGDTNPQTPIPADVGGFDMDTGVYEVSFRDNLDKPGFLRDVIPGTIKGDLSPLVTSDGWANGYVAAGDGLMPGFIGGYGLTDTFTLQAVASVVVQPIPGGLPTINTYTISVTDTGLPSQPGLAPPMQLPVSRIDTIRYSIPSTSSAAPYRNPNSPAGDGPVNALVTDNVAKEEAKRTYYTFVDSIEGSASYAWSNATTALRPRGHIKRVQHSISPDGKLNVSVAAPQTKTPAELYNLLPAEVLKFTEKQIAATNIGTRGGV